MVSLKAIMCWRLTASKSLKARCSRLKSCTTAMPLTCSWVKAVDAGDGGAHAAVALAHAVAEEAGDEEDDRQDGEGEQRQPPAHAQHDDDDEGEDEEVFEDGEDAGGEHLVEGVDVGGDAGDQAADGVAVEEGDVHALQVAEDLAAQVEHDLLAGPLHQVGLDELEHVGEAESAEVDEGELGDAGRRADVLRWRASQVELAGAASCVM